mmetsp:Transcript_41114/g.30241  ORF Transcript_41114/g.30241 Transcript_41114/m.30241 type:complete len:81 (+) Transcript_41114:274-516(+)
MNQDGGGDNYVLELISKINMEDGLPVPPKNQGEFEKYFKQKLKDPFARYTYMRLISLEQFQQFMKEEFDCELFILILRTF